MIQTFTGTKYLVQVAMVKTTLTIVLTRNVHFNLVTKLQIMLFSIFRKKLIEACKFYTGKMG